MTLKLKKRVICLYDFDGNIIDSNYMHGQLAASCIYNHFGVPFEEGLKLYFDSIGVPFPNQLDLLFDVEPAHKRLSCANEYKERKNDEVYGKAELFPEVGEALESIKEMCAIQFVCSSTEEDLINEILGRNSVKGYFEDVYGCDRGGKPDHIDMVSSKYSSNQSPDIILGD